MVNFEQLRIQGESVGLTGCELLSYIREEERTLRAEERQQEKEEAESRKEFELQKLKLQQEMQLEQRRLEFEERERERQYYLEMFNRLKDEFLTTLSSELRSLFKEVKFSGRQECREQTNAPVLRCKKYPNDQKYTPSHSPNPISCKQQSARPIESSEPQISTQVSEPSFSTPSDSPPNIKTMTRHVKHLIQTVFTNNNPNVPNFERGKINGLAVSKLLRDTGSTCFVVSDKLVPSVGPSHDKWATVYDFVGRANIFPIIRCHVECTYYTGWAECVVAPIKIATVIIGQSPFAYSQPCVRQAPTPEMTNKDKPPANPCPQRSNGPAESINLQPQWRRSQGSHHAMPREPNFHQVNENKNFRENNKAKHCHASDRETTPYDRYLFLRGRRFNQSGRKPFIERSSSKPLWPTKRSRQ